MNYKGKNAIVHHHRHHHRPRGPPPPPLYNHYIRATSLRQPQRHTSIIATLQSFALTLLLSMLSHPIIYF